MILTATVENESDFIVDLNGISANLTGKFAVDITPFFFGPVQINSHEVPTAFPLVQITALDPYTDPFGPQSGTISILGGEEIFGYDPFVLI